MSQANLIELNIPAADLAEIKTALNILTTKLAPHLITLSTSDRQELPKMGDKTLAFVTKTQEYAAQNPELVPNFLNLASFNADLQAIQILSSLVRQLSPLAANLEDSLMLSGSEAYQASLIFYRNLKQAALAGVPNAKTIYDDLSNRFPSGSARKVPTPA